MIEDFENVHLKQSALDTVLGRVVASANLVDFRTSDDELSYLLNVAPNDNDNAKDFRAKLLRQLICDGEVVVVQINNKWYIADNFTVDEKVLAEKRYSSIFVDGLELHKTFHSSEVYHFKYYNSNLSKLMKQLDNSYAKLFSRLIDVQMRQNQLRIYTKFKGINNPDGHKDEMKKYKSYLESLSSALKNNSVVVSPRNDAYDLEEKSDNYLGRSVDEIQKLENIYLAKVANALQLSPLLFTGDLADVEQHEKNAIKYAIRPLFEVLTTEINKKYFGRVHESDLIANVTPLTYNNVFEMAKDIEKIVGSSVFTPDDVLEMLGRKRTGLPEMERHYLTKNIEALDERGGENEHAKNE
ncbi:phage portal protein [Jeotgalibaca sp. MA1X17-3]|uniref:phage portal protein n=1 Tax=Jeotgalibaca sp. MA1X17-3 TaxID=2908211 RepID=UPI001F19E8D0|nr:phage portal protein [Jeotgalibaca sp. MA1X17-3]UJF15068.1 phage portal protein [Jeotgalibaca sp. MA1X17-3]